jgi:hypothetical protein
MALGGAARTIDQGDGTSAVDVVVIAPRQDELSQNWLLVALATATDRMAEDAIVVVIVPRGWRRAVERAFAAADLVLASALITVPAWPGTGHFMPIGAPLRDCGRRFLGMGAFSARAAGIAGRLGVVRRLMRHHCAGCALVATRRTGAEPCAWLAAIDDGPRALAAVSGPTRADARTALVLRYPVNESVPDLAVKVALSDGGRARLDRERTRLTKLGPGAARAGAEIPIVKRGGPGWLLSTGFVRGIPAANVLERRPAQVERVGRALVTWLTEWNRATASVAIATCDLLNRLVLEAAARVAQTDPRLGEYRHLIGDLALRMQGQPIVLVAVHNDLTMANVLDRARQIGIIDWEVADSAGLPTTDLWYALADGAARAGRISHADAVEALVVGGGRIPDWFGGAPTELSVALAVPPDERILAFHACWLHHAANELARGERDGRFLAVVRAVATKRLLWPKPASSTQST